MGDALGFLAQYGVSSVNSLLLAALYLMIRSKVVKIEDRVERLWDWHLVQKGMEKERQLNQEE